MMLSRDFFESEDYFLERFSRREAFLDLCYLAAYKNRTFKIRGIEVHQKKGQVAKSLRDLAQRWKWSVNTVVKYLNELKVEGKIDTQQTPVIQLITIKMYLVFNTQTDTQTDTQNDTQIDTPIIKNNKDNIKIKEEKDSKESKKKKEELDFSIVEEQFMPTVNDWLEYKKERGESYKPKGFKSFYGRLINLSNNDPVIAKKIIEKSMSCNYAGIFALKESEVKRDDEEDDEKLPMTKRFANWVDKYYPTIRDMEMPNNDQLNEMLRICNHEIEGYLDRLQDDYHTGSLYDLFIERFGNG